jgi:hypothetical protein
LRPLEPADLPQTGGIKPAVLVRLRNLLVHDYMFDAELFLGALFAAQKASDMLFAIVNVIDAEAKAIGLRN